MGLTQITTGGVDDNINIDGDTLKVDGVNNRVGVGITPTAPLHVSGTIQSQTGSTVAQMFTDGGAAYFTSVGAYPMLFQTNGSERARIDSSGRLLVGATSARDNYFTSASGQALQFQIEGTDYKNSCASFTSNSTSAGFGPHLAFGRSRGTAIGSNTLVNDGDTLGAIVFHGNDGSKFVQCARIDANVDGTPGSNDMPGRLIFQTTADGASSPTERMRIDSNGVLISSHATINGGVIGTNGNELRLQSDINANGTPFTSFYTGSSERMRIDSSGRLLVGTSSTSATCTSVFAGRSDGATDPVLRLEVNSTSPANGSALGGLNFASSGLSAFQAGARIAAVRDGGTWTNGSSHPTYLEFATTADGASSPTERMRITSSGNVGINYDSPTAKLEVKEDTSSASTTIFRVKSNWSNSNQTQMLVLSDGDVENRNNAYRAISDAKLKENIVDANSQWEDIKNLRVRNYNFIQGAGDPTQTHIGLVAQEVEPISPGLVKERADEDESGNDLGTVTKSVNYSVLYMKAVKALQEAMDRIETLEAKVAALVAAE